MRKQLLSILKSDFAKSSSLIFVAVVIANLIIFLANLYISRAVGPDDFGLFKTIIYLFSFFPLIIDLGVNFTLTKYIAEFRSNFKEKIGYMIRWLFKIKILSYLVLVFIFLVFEEQVATILLKDASLSYLIIPSVLLTFFTIFSTFEAIVIGFQKFKLYAISQFLTLTISSVLGILLLPFGLFYAILGWGLGPLFGNLFNIKFFFENKSIKSTKEFDVRSIFYRFSIPMLLTNIPVGLASLIVPLLSLFFASIMVGYFSFAFIFYFAALLIPNSLSIVLFPKISELNGLKKHTDAKNFLKRTFVIYTPIVLIGILIVILFSEQIINLISKEYLPSLFMFKVLISLGLIFGYNIIYTNYLRGLGRIKLFALLTLIQNLLLIAISFIIITT